MGKFRFFSVLLLAPAQVAGCGSAIAATDIIAQGLAASALQKNGDASNTTVIPTGTTTAKKTADLLASLTNPNIIIASDPKNGSCIWDGSTSHDVGPCINSAIAAAAALGGANVIIPAGKFYFATNIVITTSGVNLAGQGLGIPRDNAGGGGSAAFQAITTLAYNGPAEAGPAVSFYPGGVQTLHASGIDGVLIDCQSLVDTCMQVTQDSFSKFYFAQAEARKTGVLFNTNNVDGLGNQHSDISIWARNVNPSYSASGIVLDAGAGSSFNTSYNRIHTINVAYGAGDGIVFGNDDTNIVDQIYSYHYGTATTGSPVVCANGSGYTPPSGVPTNGHCYDNDINLSGAPIWIQGATQGATFVATGGNTGTMAIAPVSLVTTAAMDYSSNTLTFASVSGVSVGQAASCGGVTGGIYPNSYVTAVTGTTVSLSRPGVHGGGINGVASGATCTFSLGANSLTAVGAYTITATNGTTVNITAPAGGDSQSGVAISGGAIKAQDFTLPVSGTPVAGDSWTLTFPQPAIYNRVVHMDRSNNISDPYFEPGAQGWGTYGYGQSPAYSGTSTQCLSYYSLDGAELPSAGCTGRGSFFMGSTGTNAGIYSVLIGGGSDFILAPSFYGVVIGGQNNTVQGNYSGIFAGYQVTDRRHYGVQAFGAGDFTTVGDAQIETFVLRGSGATASAFRLTGDQLAAGAFNCVNIPNNTAAQVSVHIMAYDHTTTTKNEAWGTWDGLLTRGASAAATALTMATTPTPQTNGTVTGSAIAATADTTNGCLNISFTPPTSNTDTWNVVARVETVEVQ